MEISVIIPIYNTKVDILKRCIDSINFNDIKFEIILIDDGSKEEKSNEYKRINIKNLSYYKQKNKGVSSARNLGMRKAKGDYLLFVDSDDILYANCIEIELLNLDYDVLVYNSLFLKNDKKYEKKEINAPEGEISIIDVLLDYIKNGAMHSPCYKLYKKSFLVNNYIFFQENMIQSEDAIFNLDVLENNPKIYYVNKILYGYFFDYQTSSSRWEKQTKLMFDNLEYYYQRKKNIAKRYNLPEEISYVIDKMYISNIFSLCVDKYKNNDILDISRNNIAKNKDIKIDNLYIYIKYCLILSKNVFLLKIIAKIRNQYLKKIKRRY